MTVPELARRAKRDRDWVRGAADAKGIARTRIGTADFIDAEGCEIILDLAKSSKRRQRYAHAS